MVTSTTQLEAFLESNAPFWLCDLYTFTLVNGAVLRVTSFDRAISYGGHTFLALGPYIQRSKLRVGVGGEASSVEVQMIADPSVQINSQAILLAIAQGKFSGAQVTIRRAFMTAGDVASNPVVCNLTGAGDADGTILRYAGEVGEVTEVTTLSATFEVRGLMFRLQRPTPKRVFQPGCWHTFCDAGCALSAADFTTTGTVTSGSTKTVVRTGLAQDSSIPGAPTSAPSLTSVSADIQLPWMAYYVVYTYVTKYGETTASPESRVIATPGHVPQMAGVAPVANAVGINIYAGDGMGNEQLQNSTPWPFLTAWTASASGIYQSGIIPPQIPSTGYWAQGRITFTSGANNGLSAFIQGSNGSGAIALAAPLPVAPSAGDTFTIFAGCDKTVQACQSRVKIGGAVVDNTSHFTGCPSVPSPEIGLG